MNPSADKSSLKFKALELNQELIGCEKLDTKKFTFQDQIVESIDYMKQSACSSTKIEQMDDEECKFNVGLKKPRRSEASSNLSGLVSE